MLTALDEEHEHIQSPASGARDRPFLSHGARR
jgi:hypothetical protein